MNILSNLFRGRINKSQFATGMGLTILLEILLMFVAVAFDPMPYWFQVIFALLACSVTISFISLHWRRLHDIGHSGLITLSYIIPILGICLFLYLIFKNGNAEANKYGEVPPQIMKSLDIILGRIN